MSESRLGVIGAGNMGWAILRAVLTNWQMPSEAIVVAEPDQARHRQLAGSAIRLTTDNREAAACPRVLLAVKPQVMAGVLEEIAPAVQPDALIVSVAAGWSTASIDRLLGGKGRLVRVMPNTPMLVGEGMSAIAAGPRATPEDMDWVERIFGSGGKTCRVDESQMDAVTAVSGSGPAYVFYLAEAMIAAGVAEGLDERTANLLARATIAGAGKMLMNSSDAPADLRHRVTSPGGTTQAAIRSMDEHGVGEALVEAIRAAAARSRELGK